VFCCNHNGSDRLKAPQPDPIFVGDSAFTQYYKNATMEFAIRVIREDVNLSRCRGV